MRRLIINADDFGYSEGVNRAILECAEAGVVTSATLIAGGAAFEHAANAAKHKALGVGCHVVLVDGAPVSDAHGLRSLVEDGRFRGSIHQLARSAVTGDVNADEVKREAMAQIAKVRSAGITVTHFDTHKHAHAFPRLFRPLLEAAKAARVSAVRNPFEPFSIHWISSPGLWIRGAESTALRSFREPFLRAVKEIGLKTTDGAVGIAATGQLDMVWLERIVRSLPEGTWELVCHPGYLDDGLRAANTRLKEAREVEREALMSERFARVLEEEKIHLISYNEL